MDVKSNKILVYKNTGEQDVFSEEKLIKALLRAGASEKEANLVLNNVKSKLYNGISTGKIYKIAYKILKNESKRSAGRFRLKKAVMDLGPSGYPFEKFVGRLFENKGYNVKIDRIIKGKCVTHEVDVIARNDTEQIMVECKFHSAKGQKSDVKVPLYINSRFRDIKYSWEKDEKLKGLHFFGMIATNTRFTEDAKKFANCSGLKILSWDYPNGNSLREWIDKSGFHPITALQSLKKKDKEVLLNNNIVLCRELESNQAVLRNMGFSESDITKIISEANNLIS
jgi:Holliday junction resolvase-like predicted endonuclease